MKYEIFKKLSKILEKKQINEKTKLSDLNFDSLKIFLNFIICFIKILKT